MLNFQLNEEQQMLTDAIKRLASERMRKVFRDAEEEEKIPQSVIDAGWEMGLLPTAVPEEFGGLGEYSVVTQAMAVEELAFGDLAITANILYPNNVAIPVMVAGTDAQKEAHLPLFMEAKQPNVTAALTEPIIQFDPRGLKTTAVLDGDHYIINGNKSVVPMAETAETILVYANEDGKTQAYFVPVGVEGLTIGAKDKLMGVRALPTNQISLENVRIPVENKLGGDAGIDFNLILNHSRIALGAAAVGVARAGYEYAVEYAKQRIQFDEPIAHRQSIAFMLAEMSMDVDGARMLVWEAAWKMDNGEDVTQDVAVMKHFIDDMVMRVADQALQVLGGYGYIREYPVELWFRNARGFATFDGLLTI